MSNAYLTEAMQDESEIAAFCDLLAGEGVRSYLEIGSKFGGSLWRVGAALAPGARIVSVDLPGGTKRWEESRPSLKGAHYALRDLGHETHMIWGNSTDPDVIAQAAALGPFDAILIDGDHRLPGLTLDWQNYGPMGRIIAFHDIGWARGPDFAKTRIDVPEFWEALKDSDACSNWVEFKYCPTGKNNGIGVLWR